MNSDSDNPLFDASGCRPIQSEFTVSRWNRLRRAQVGQFALAVCLGAMLVDQGAAQGIPEPSFVMYGTVRNAQDRDRLRVVFGNLTWQFQPVGGGAPFVVSATLTNINDQFSYVLRVPCETEIPGFTLSTNALRLGSSYTRDVVFFNATNPATLVDPGQATFSLATTARGLVERVDLDVSVAFEDLDGNGLPDAWERLFFGGIGVDPTADPDGDGLSNRAENKAGTNPNDFQSQFRFIRITPQAGSAKRFEVRRLVAAIFANRLAGQRGRVQRPRSGGVTVFTVNYQTKTKHMNNALQRLLTRGASRLHRCVPWAWSLGRRSTPAAQSGDSSFALPTILTLYINKLCSLWRDASTKRICPILDPTGRRRLGCSRTGPRSAARSTFGLSFDLHGH